MAGVQGAAVHADHVGDGVPVDLVLAHGLVVAEAARVEGAGRAAGRADLAFARVVRAAEREVVGVVVGEEGGGGAVDGGGWEAWCRRGGGGGGVGRWTRGGRRGDGW